MLKKLTIRNFKAIQDLTIEFTPLTVLIGENACGKTTLLQAIEFFCSAASRDIPEYLKEKDWRFSDLKSQYENGANAPIEFESVFVFDDNIQVEWFLYVDFKDSKWNIREQINKNGKGVISYNKMPIVQDTIVTPGIPNPFKEIPLESSLLKIIDNIIIDEYKLGDQVIINRDNFRAIVLLKDFLAASKNYGLLSVDKMRIGQNDIVTHDIGSGGQVLFWYIDSLKEEERGKLINKISQLIGIELNIKVLHRQSRAELIIEEKRNNTWVRINDQHISDGILRLIALNAITIRNDIKQKGIILLDEIENGINPYKTEQVISIYRELVEKQGVQVLLTTHSPVMLNDFDSSEIVFLWKDKNGLVHSRKFFDTKEMQENLEFLNPGEIWINYGKEVILKKLGVNSEDR